jgi:hypothetical protein
VSHDGHTIDIGSVTVGVPMRACSRCLDLAAFTLDEQRRPICEPCREAEHARWVSGDPAEWKDVLELEDCDDGGDW